MCGRLHIKGEDLDEFRELRITPDLSFLERFNVTPSQPVPVIRPLSAGLLTADLMIWGLIPKWAKKVSDIQSLARAESIAAKPTFRDAFAKRRCIIPAAGYYEWQVIAGQKVKQPWYFKRSTKGILRLAGIWETSESISGDPIETFAIITTSPNDVAATVHERMPVILDEAESDEWLDSNITDSATLQTLLKSCPDSWLMAHPVSVYVNSPSNNGPKCIEPVKLQRGLFD